MEYLNTSFFVALLVRFWDKLTELFRGGIFHRMAMAIWNCTQRGLCFGFAIGGDFAADKDMVSDFGEVIDKGSLVFDFGATDNDEKRMLRIFNEFRKMGDFVFDEEASHGREVTSDGKGRSVGAVHHGKAILDEIVSMG